MNQARTPTPETDAALKRTQGMFRAASAMNGFTDHARSLEMQRDALRVALEEIMRDTERQQLPITTMIYLKARAALQPKEDK